VQLSGIQTAQRDSLSDVWGSSSIELWQPRTETPLEADESAKTRKSQIQRAAGVSL
jgi:hypothetical protein